MAGAGGKGKGNGSAMTRPKGAAGGETSLAAYGADSFDELSAKAGTDIGGGTTPKEQLIGVDMNIIAVKWQPSTVGDGDFAIVTVVTKELGQVVFTDGSSGVAKQLRELQDSGVEISPETPQRVRGGLKLSKYKSSVTGQPAETYWLNNSMSDADKGAAVAVGKSTVGTKIRNGARA